MTAENPPAFHAQYEAALARYQVGDFDAARRAFAACVRTAPTHYPSLAHLGLLLEREKAWAPAASAFLRAIRIAESLPRNSIPPEMRRLLAHASQRVSDRLYFVLSEIIRASEAAYGKDTVRRVEKFVETFTGKRPGEFAHPLWRPQLAYLPDLPPRPFFERSEIPWLERLEAATPVIRDELRGILDSGAGLKPYVNHAPNSTQAQDWRQLNRSSDWSGFHFFRHGRRIEENCARCPQTAKLLEEVDLIRIPGFGPEVMFSVLRPHTVISPHYGSINGRLIIHLPLIVPPQCGGLTVAGETRTWHEGQCLVFDDSFEHSARNDSDETRVVLILDAWNPLLSQAERHAFSSVLQAAQRYESELLGMPLVQDTPA